MADARADSGKLEARKMGLATMPRAHQAPIHARPVGAGARAEVTRRQPRARCARASLPVVGEH